MRRTLALIAGLITLSLIVAAPAAAKRPGGGDMDLYLNFGFGMPGAPCPAVTWAGTVELGGDLYGIAFMATGAKDVGATHHFSELWEVYDAPFDFTGGVLVECTAGDLVLAGDDRGVGTMVNGRFHMSGRVSAAAPPFEDWLGRVVYIKGSAIVDPASGVPLMAPGSFRLN